VTTLGDLALPRRVRDRIDREDAQPLDVEALARGVAGGAEVVQEPTDQPYGIRDRAIRDPAGNLIRINEIKA
jgi:uncharacterized glyoxalase superfamily protein PhnB